MKGGRICCGDTPSVSTPRPGLEAPGRLFQWEQPTTDVVSPASEILEHKPGRDVSGYKNNYSNSEREDGISVSRPSTLL